MTARRVIPPLPAPPAGPGTARRAEACADWLAAGAAGLLTETAAVSLLAEHGTWLSRPSFTSRCIHITDDLPGAGADRTAAGVRWPAAISALDRQPASGSEKAVLRIAASIAAGIPVSLRDCLGSLDTPALRAVLRAIAYASSGHAGQDLIRHGSQPPSEPLP
jgi:hypothetical protein